MPSVRVDACISLDANAWKLHQTMKILGKNISSKLCLLFLSGWILSGCDNPPEVAVAISEPGQTEFDRKLLGQWYLSEANDDTIIIRIQETERGVLQGDAFLLGDYASDDAINWFRSEVHASEIDGEIYYNIQLIGGGTEEHETIEKRSSYLIAKVEFTENSNLRIKVLGGDYVDGLISDGKLRGHTEIEEFLGDYFVADITRQELIDLIRNHPTESLFDYEGGVYRRLEPTDQEFQ